MYICTVRVGLCCFVVVLCCFCPVVVLFCFVLFFHRCDARPCNRCKPRAHPPLPHQTNTTWQLPTPLPLNLEMAPCIMQPCSTMLQPACRFPGCSSFGVCIASPLLVLCFRHSISICSSSCGFETPALEIPQRRVSCLVVVVNKCQLGRGSMRVRAVVVTACS